MEEGEVGLGCRGQLGFADCDVVVEDGDYVGFLVGGTVLVEQAAVLVQVSG